MRVSLLPLAAGLFAAGLSSSALAQTREADLLDELVRRLDICREIRGTADRLGCYDKIDTSLGAAPKPVPPSDRAFEPAGQVRPGQPQPGDPRPLGGGLTPAPTGGAGQTIGPPPGMQPGSGVAVTPPPPPPPPPPSPTTDRRGSSRDGYVTPGNRLPVVSLAVRDFRDQNFRWEAIVDATNNSFRTIDVTVACDFSNAGVKVADTTVSIPRVGQNSTGSARAVGPSTTTYVDRIDCRLISPLQ